MLFKRPKFYDIVWLKRRYGNLFLIIHCNTAYNFSATPDSIVQYVFYFMLSLSFYDAPCHIRNNIFKCYMLNAFISNTLYVTYMQRKNILCNVHTWFKYIRYLELLTIILKIRQFYCSKYRILKPFKRLSVSSRKVGNKGRGNDLIVRIKRRVWKWERNMDVLRL